MPTEYHIQKRSLAVWQYVTWYETLEEAQKNFKALVQDQGWSYRIVALNVVEEVLLDGERPVMAPEAEPVRVAWRTPPATPAAQGWANLTSGASFKDMPPAVAVEDAVLSTHGLTGSVWVGNPVTKEKKRVNSEVAIELFKTGNWIKSGPRTVL